MKSYTKFIADIVLHEENEFVQGLSKVTGQLGSNKGGRYQHTSGEHYYIKFPKNPEQAKTEVLAGRIQKLMGISTLESEHHIINGESAVVSKWVPDLKKLTHKNLNNLTPEQHHDIGRLFASSVLIKNWDSTGTGMDYGEGNIDIHKSGKLYGIDPGGSFEFRAQGGHKNYTPDIAEAHSLRDKNLNWESANVYNTVFKKTPEALTTGINAVRNLKDEDIYNAFATSGLKNWQELHRTFNERKKLFLSTH